MPGLVDLFEHFATEMGRNVSSLLSDSPYCKLDSVEPALLADVFSATHAPRIGILHAADIDARAFVVFDRLFDWVMIDSAFGADSGSIGQGNGPTRIRRTRAGDRFVAESARMAAQALGAAFSGICPLSFSLEKMMEDNGFALEKHQAPMIAARVSIKMKSRECGLALLMPHSIVGQMRNALAESPSKATRESDPVWSRDFESAVINTPLKVFAVMEDLELTLGQVADLKVGQTLPLRRLETGRVRVLCNGQELFRCHMSQSDERYELAIE